MKSLFLFTVSVLCLQVSYAQSNLGDRLKERSKKTLENRLEQKVDKTLNKGVDKVEEKVDSVAVGDKSKKTSGKQAGSEQSEDKRQDGTGESKQSGKSESGNKALVSYSKYDFIPGSKIIVQEDFMQDAVGDFPAKWNTNSGGEIVTVEGLEGHWLKLQKEGCFLPEFITDLPENFTFEYDICFSDNYNYYSTELFTNFVSAKKPSVDFMKWARFPSGNDGIRFTLHPTDAGNKAGISNSLVRAGSEEIMENTVSVNQLWSGNGRNKVHVSVWRQKGRLRVYLNEEKIWDLPRAFQEGVLYNTIVFSLGNMHQPEDYMLISNLRLAVGAPDTRNKLLTEGKLVTHGILFDSGSDNIKGESYGTLKEIATVLKENPDVKVKIIGHTDSDGEDARNLELSKKRALAVKNALVKEFGIDASRLETDGKGESEPSDSNTTPAGKANNRRVEFIKL